jgi:23S rRNA pseudouridine1911/1915/1917 synthase
MTDPSQEQQHFTAGPDEAGERLDAFLVARCPQFSRTRIQGDLQEGRVQVDGRSRPKGFRLKAGMRVSYDPAPLQELTAVPQDLPLEFVYRDEDIAIINKAVGMVVHPAVGHPDGTVVNALLHHVQDMDAGMDPLRPGIVHRLDRDTSGLLAVALNDRAHRHLADQLRDRRMGRTYLALSWGRWAETCGTLTGDIGRHPRLRQKMAVVERDGRPATTHYEVLADHGFVQFCRVKLETGRTHQIRVHFAHNHHPIVGDPLYGDDTRAKAVHALDRTRAAQLVKAVGRQMLHAARLELEHPVSGEQLVFEAPLPADMEQALAHLEETGPEAEGPGD